MRAWFSGRLALLAASSCSWGKRRLRALEAFGWANSISCRVLVASCKAAPSFVLGRVNDAEHVSKKTPSVTPPSQARQGYTRILGSEVLSTVLLAFSSIMLSESKMSSGILAVKVQKIKWSDASNPKPQQWRITVNYAIQNAYIRVKTAFHLNACTASTWAAMKSIGLTEVYGKGLIFWYELLYYGRAGNGQKFQLFSWRTTMLTTTAVTIAYLILCHSEFANT